MMRDSVRHGLKWIRKIFANSATCPVDQVSQRLVFETLEPRLLLSADWGGGLDYPEALLAEHVVQFSEIAVSAVEVSSLQTVAVQDRGQQSAEPDAPYVSTAMPSEPSSGEPALELPSPPADADKAAIVPSSLRHEIVFVDTSVEDYEPLLADLLAQDNPGRQVQIRVLDGQRDGITQISEVLAGYQNIDAVHIVSHGAEGAVQLGNTWLDLETLHNAADAIGVWGKALTADADILLYGCNLAASAEGTSLVQTLSEFTGADVAASLDLTSNTLLGGDWELERTVGHIDTTVPFSTGLQSQWGGTLSATDPLWLTTDGNVTGGGQPGTDTWQKGDLIQVADPNLAFEPGTTNGTFTVAFDVELFAPGQNVNAVHYVTSDIQLGTSNFQLKAGDLLLSTDSGTTVTSVSTPVDAGFTNNLVVDKQDVFVFRPNTPGDYSAGTFAMLLENLTGGGDDIRGISLLEQDATVGDANLLAGDFLFTRSGGAEDSDIWLFQTTDVGAGNTNGIKSVLMEGTDVLINNKLFGIDLVEETMTIGGRTLNAGNILLSVDAAELVGPNALSVTQYDIFALDVTQTTLVAGAGNGAATASLFFQGADVAFNSASEVLNGFTLTVNQLNDSPNATITPASYVVTENVPLNLHNTGLTVSDPDANSNPVQVTLSVGEGTLTVGSGSTGITVSGSGTGNVILDGTLSQISALLAGDAGATILYDTLEAPSASTTLTLLIDDLGNTGSGGPLTAADTATLNIAAVNDGPSATITPTSYAVTENVPLNLHGTGLTVSDVDASSNPVQVILAVGEGLLTVEAGSSGVTVTGSGTASVTLDGTLTQLHNLLAGNFGATLVYDAIHTPSASTTLTLLIDDLGNSGSGGSLTASATAILAITGVDVAPEEPPVVEPETPILQTPELLDPTAPLSPRVSEPTSQDPNEEVNLTDQPILESTLQPDVPDLPVEAETPATPPAPNDGSFQTVNNDTDSRASEPVNTSPESSRPSDRRSNKTETGTLALEETEKIPSEVGIEDTQVNTATSDHGRSVVASNEFVQALDKLREEIRDQGLLVKTIAGSTFAVTTSLSIGYVLWLVRGGILLSSVLSSLPAWRLVDPLPVLASLDKRSEEQADDDSLESVIHKGAEAAKAKHHPREPHTKRDIAP